MRGVEEFGGPENLSVVQVDPPTAGPGQVRVRVRVAGLNPVDCKNFRGPAAAAMEAHLPSGVGNDFSGLIDSSGSGHQLSMKALEKQSAATDRHQDGREKAGPGFYPAMAARVNQVEPVPRRIRGYIGGALVVDTVRALYVWEWANYPQYYIPSGDVRPGALVDEGHVQQTRRGSVRRQGVRVGDVARPGAARLVTDSPIEGLNGTVRFEWDALDSWFEEDEQVFVHPRNPYVRVDALRSTRPVSIEMEGVVLAESTSPVMVFETGLPTRFYVARTDVSFEHLAPTATVTECPYKGKTTGYWSVVTGGTVHPDLAWSYDFPTRQLSPIAGMLAFYNEWSTSCSTACFSNVPRRTSSGARGVGAPGGPRPSSLSPALVDIDALSFGQRALQPAIAGRPASAVLVPVASRAAGSEPPGTQPIADIVEISQCAGTSNSRARASRSNARNCRTYMPRERACTVT